MAEPDNKLRWNTNQARVIELARLAPTMSSDSRQLSRRPYDGIVFHRVIDGVMAQTGCPHGTGTGGRTDPNCRARVQQRGRT